MSAMSVVLLLAAATAAALGAAALHAARGLRAQLTALRAELAASERAKAARVPHARATPAAEIRAAVADALAEERERELAEARAFWAAQEARDAADGALPGLSGFAGPGGLSGAEPLPGQGTPYPGLSEMAETLEGIDAVDAAIDAYEQSVDAGSGPETEEPPELAAARRRHPSHPSHPSHSAQDRHPAQAGEQAGDQGGGVPAPPAIADHDRTMARLEELAASATPLTDVRPGPLGTLDVYLFADGTTLCMAPGHGEAAERLAAVVRAGGSPVLVGGSGVSGAYALTFAYSDLQDRCVYVLADRVIASL